MTETKQEEEKKPEEIEQPQPPAQRPTGAVPIEQRIKMLEEMSPYFRALIYGDPGVGKTKFCIDPGAKTLMLDCDHSALTLYNHPELIPATLVLEVRTVRDFSEVLWKIRDGGFPEVDTVLIDGFSELQRKALDEWLDVQAARDKNRSKFLAFQQDYNINTNMMRRLVVEFRDLEKNLIITCHALEEKLGENSPVTTRPDVTPKLASMLRAPFDLLGFMWLEDSPEQGKPPNRFLQVHPSRRVTAKTRVGGLPPVILNPNIAQIMAMKKRQIENAKRLIAEQKEKERTSA